MLKISLRNSFKHTLNFLFYFIADKMSTKGIFCFSVCLSIPMFTVCFIYDSEPEGRVHLLDHSVYL